MEVEKNKPQNECESKTESSNVMAGDTNFTPKSESFLKTKRGKIILFSLVGIALIAIIVGVAVACSKKGNDDKKEKEANGTENPENPLRPDTENPIEPEKEKTEYVNHKLNEILVYEEIQEKKTSVNLNEDAKQLLGKQRLLTDSNISHESKLTIKYLLNVYKVDESVSPKLYHAYVFILSMTNNVRNKNMNDVDSDIRTMTTVTDSLPVAEVVFDALGEKKSFKVSKEINEILAVYINDFVDKVIPQLSESSFGLNRNISNNGDSHEINEIISGNYEGLDDSTLDVTLSTEISKEQVKKIVETKKTSLVSDNNNQMDLTVDNDFTSVQNDENTVKKGLIEGVKSEILSTTILNDKESEVNEEVTKKIESLLKTVNLNNYSPQNSRRLEFVPNQQFEKKMRNLETFDIESYAMPIYFVYPLFRTNNLGMKIGLIAKIEFLPMTSTINMKIIFDLNGKQSEILAKSEKIVFKDILDKINEILENAYLFIQTTLSRTISTSLENLHSQIDSKIEELVEVFGDLPTYDKIFLNDEEPYFNKVFYSQLKHILEFVNNTVAHCYNECWENTSATNKTYGDLLVSIKEKKNTYINSIINSSSNSIVDFLRVVSGNVTDLYTLWNQFYGNVTENLEEVITKVKNGERIVFDTGLYYDLKDEMNKFVTVYKNFESNLLESIKAENLSFYLYIEENFNTIVNPKLKEVEEIAEKAQNNASVIDSMDIFFGQKEGSRLRNRMIEQINYLRNAINLILQEIFKQIEDVYNEKLSEQGEIYSTLKTDITNNLEKLTDEYNDLIVQLKNFNKYDQEFDIYFEDIKVINEIESKTISVRKESFKKNIIEFLNNKEKEILGNAFSDFDNKVHEWFQKIYEEAKTLHWTDARIVTNQTIKDIKNLINQNLGEQLINKLITAYSNPEFHSQMLGEYYSYMYSTYFEFNSTFYMKNYLIHAPLYVIKPTEIMSKLLNITYNLNIERDFLFELIQTIIIQRIENAYSRVLTLLNGTIEREINELEQIIYSSKCCVNGYNLAYSRQIINSLKEIYSFFDDKSIKLTFNRTKKDEFGFLELFNEKEDYIVSIITRILDQINIDFQNYFCYGNELVCEYNDSTSAIEHYYYQASKLRSSVSNLNLFIQLAREMIGENILSELSSDEYTNKFNVELEYKISEIVTNIFRYIEELNNKTIEFMDGHLDTLNLHINASFVEVINIAGIEENIKLIAQEVFIDHKELTKQMLDYLYDPCGPFAKLEMAFNKEYNTHRSSSNNNFKFDLQSYSDSYSTLINEIISEYQNKKNTYLTEIQVPSSLIDLISMNITTNIFNAYYSVYDKVISISDVTEFEFLNMTYSISSITLELLESETNSLVEQAVDSLHEIYENYLKTFRTKVIENFDQYFNQILSRLEYQFNATSNKYNINQNPESNYVINKINVSTATIMDNIVDLFFEKSDEVYSPDNLRTSFEFAQEKALDVHSFKNKVSDFSSLILTDILEFYEMSIQRFRQEKYEFQAAINGFFISAFKEYAKLYIENVGQSYLEQIIKEDYNMNIDNVFRFFNTNIKDIYNFDDVLLDTAELKGLGYKLIVGIRDSFPYVREKILEIIPGKIETVIYPKLDVFKNEIQNKMVELFINYITGKDSDSYMKNKFSNKIYELIPKTYNDAFRAILKDHFNEFITPSINNIKNQYKTDILDNLNLFNQTYYGYEVLIVNKVAQVTVTKLEGNWFLLSKIIDRFNPQIEKYNVILELTVSDNKKTNIITFLNNIESPLQAILTGYNNQVGYGQKQLNDALDHYALEFPSSYNLIKQDIEKLDIENNIRAIKANLELLVFDFYLIIQEEFKKIPNQLQNECESINFEGFAKKTNTNTRRLDDSSYQSYNLTILENSIKNIENLYISFKDKVLSDDTFKTVEHKKYSFSNYFTGTASHLTDYFYAYQSLVALYTDNTRIEKLFNKLEEDATKIRKYLIEFTNTQTGLIDNTVDVVRSGIKQSWIKSRPIINKYLYSTLDDIFKRKFKDINNIDLVTFNNITNPDIGTLKLEDFLSVNVKIKNIEAQSSYEVKKQNDYDFKVNINAGSAIYLELESTIENSIKYSTEGYLANGNIGLSADYILHDMSVDIDSSYVQTENEYYNYLKEYDFENNEWEVLIKDNVTVPKFDNIHMRKSYRKRW